MWGRLNPLLGWTWKDDKGRQRPYLLYNLSINAGMISGRIYHSSVLATRPIADFDRMSLDGREWLPAQDLLSLIPKEMDYGLPKPVMHLQVTYCQDLAPVL